VTTKEGRHVIFWSGGADSTLLLHRLATNSSATWPIVALTANFDQPANLNEHQFKAQRDAQSRFLDLAKSRGHHIEQVIVDVKSKFDLADNCGQPMLWLGTLMPYVRDHDEVHFGYIRPDTVWHVRDQFVDAFQAFAKLGQAENAKPVFDLEWETKENVLSKLKEARIPLNCFWSCENVTENGYACGRCSKCYEFMFGVAEMVGDWSFIKPKPKTLSVEQTSLAHLAMILDAQKLWEKPPGEPEKKGEDDGKKATEPAP
jgi:7-cyano-7-deazaguanine synthase in queuosine biosynthesis